MNPNQSVLKLFFKHKTFSLELSSGWDKIHTMKIQSELLIRMYQVERLPFLYYICTCSRFFIYIYYRFYSNWEKIAIHKSQDGKNNMILINHCIEISHVFSCFIYGMSKRVNLSRKSLIALDSFGSLFTLHFLFILILMLSKPTCLKAFVPSSRLT